MILQKLPKSKYIKKNIFAISLIIFSFLSIFLQRTATVKADFDSKLLNSPWTLSANNGAKEASVKINNISFSGKDTLSLTFNLHGLNLLPGDASAVIFEQPEGDWHYISLAKYAQNGLNQYQTVEIPLSQFLGLDTNQTVARFHIRIWHSSPFTVDISSAVLTNKNLSSPSPDLIASVINSPWTLTGSNGASEKYQTVNPSLLNNGKSLAITYNLHGLNLLGNDASALIFDQNNLWHYVSLSKYGQNGFDGVQTVNIPLADFRGLDLTKPVGTFHVRFWSKTSFNIDLVSIVVAGASAQTPAPSPSPSPSPSSSTNPPATGGSWAIRSVSSMKETKDKVCSRDSADFIKSWVEEAKKLGVNYVAVETPYDNPSCASSVSYTKDWIDAIRAAGLKVWHRHMPLAFEGIYSAPKTKGDYLNMISGFIKNNPTFFDAGDIFSPIPEPQNGGISGITYCAQGVCQFDNAQTFNAWLRNSMSVSEEAFKDIGLGGKIKIGYFGFDGFVAWGDNNPDWNGILEDATIAQMGNITIDHYPQLINSNMTADLDEVQARYPGVPIIIGEWGTVGTTDPVQQVADNMGAAKRPGVVGFNYWHMGMGGNEALINSDFSPRPAFQAVRSFFTSAP